MTDVQGVPTGLSVEQQQAALNAEIARYAAKGWTVQHSSGPQAVLSRVKRMGWFWNLILCLVTSGLWLIYVIYRALNRKTETVTLTVDQSGRVRAS